MSSIKFIGLGGLQEEGKNLYVIEVDKRIFVLDAGIKYPTSELYGVDYIVPNISYLIENKDRVVGIFLTHAHIEHIGAVGNILKEIPTKVYGSRFTLAVLKDMLDHDKIKYKGDSLIEVKRNQALNFGEVKVRFFQVAHNIPEALAISILTADGNILYTGNYNFDQNIHVDYAAMFRSLAVFAKEGVLALLTESLGASDSQNRGTILEFKLRLNQILATAQGRVIFSIFSSDIARMQQVIDIGVANNRRIAIIGRKTQRIVNIAMNLGYLKIDEKHLANLRYIDEKNKNLDNDLLVLVCGERHEPYYMLQRMSRGIDRLVSICATDTVAILTNPFIGTEKMAARTLDIIYRRTSNVRVFKENLMPSSNASREEIKQMINILKPKYIIPVIGEYRHQYACAIVADCVGHPQKNFLIADCGDVLEFKDGNYTGISGEVAVGENLVDGKAFSDVGDVVMHDRELLAEDGVFLISALVNPKTKQISPNIEIITKGFIYVKDNEELLNQVKELLKKVATKHFTTKFINWSDLKSALRNEIGHYLYKATKRNPIVIPVLISTELV